MNSAFQTASAKLLAGLLLLSALFSCSKDPYEIGIDLLPASDTLNVRTTDTCTIEAFSVVQDSVRSDKTTSLMFGSISDPVFGKTTVGFYSQARLSEDAPDFGTNPVLDSLVLMLFYTGYYGDTTTMQNVKVYEMSEYLDFDSLKFSNQTIGTYPTLLADQDFVPHYSDSVMVGGKKYPPHLRINLSKKTNYLGYKILNAPASELASNYTFLKFMKGLYVTGSPVNQKGAILNFSVSSSYIPRLSVYYHDGTDPQNDSLEFSMYMNEVCARFIHTDHNDYLDADHDLKQQILNHDSARGAEKLFLQGMGGVKVKVKIPYFANFAGDKLVAINDAVLEMKNFETDTVFGPPASLYLYRQDSAGRIGYLADEGEGASYFGGIYNASTNSYQFRITEHLQNILQNVYTTRFNLYMMVNTPIKNAVTPNRVVLSGTNPLIPGIKPERFKLKITYTVLNKN